MANFRPGGKPFLAEKPPGLRDCVEPVRLGHEFSRKRIAVRANDCQLRDFYSSAARNRTIKNELDGIRFTAGLSIDQHPQRLCR